MGYEPRAGKIQCQDCYLQPMDKNVFGINKTIDKTAEGAREDH